MHATDKPPRNLASSILWAALLGLLGFLHPMFFVFAAFMAWLTWYQLKNPYEERLRIGSGRRPIVAADDADWKKRFLEACDSPAEEAFLSTMTQHFSLRPFLGLLKGGGLTLELQVQIDCFRVDFLANEWLVIEVDGAAWHSSPEAMKRDAERDNCLGEHGYQVLRLPAKLVFDHPGEAVRRVEGALQAGKPQLLERAKPAVNFSKAIADIVTYIDETNDCVRRTQEVEKTLRPARDVIDTERMLLDGALEHALLEIEIGHLRGKSKEHARHYDKNHALLSAALNQYEKTNGTKRQSPQPIHLMPLLRPPAHSDGHTHEAVQATFDQLLSDRERFFAEVREKAAEDPRIEAHAREYLAKFECERLWEDATCEPARRKAKSRIVPGEILKAVGQKTSEDRKSRPSAFGKQLTCSAERQKLSPTERRGPPLQEMLRSQATKPSNSS